MHKLTTSSRLGYGPSDQLLDRWLKHQCRMLGVESVLIGESKIRQYVSAIGATFSVEPHESQRDCYRFTLTFERDSDYRSFINKSKMYHSDIREVFEMRNLYGSMAVIAEMALKCGYDKFLHNDRIYQHVNGAWVDTKLTITDMEAS